MKTCNQKEQRLRHEMKQASAVLCMFLLTQLNSLPPFSTRATSFLVLTFAGCCPFLAHLQSIYTETSLELLTVDIRAKQTPKPNFPLRLPVPARCSFTITIHHGGPNTSSLPVSPTCLHVQYHLGPFVNGTKIGHGRA